MKEDKKYHTGHRKRLRNRYIENGIDALAEHEILELVLFYSVPRVDTKPMAHKLIDEYGSLKNVFSAPFESLRAHGLSEASAAHIKLYSDLGAWFDRNSVNGMTLCDYNESGRFMVRELDGCSSEVLAMLMLDSKNKVLGIKIVCEGGFSNTKVSMKRIVEYCLEKKAAKIILAHNHPSGDVRPSAEDYAVTKSIENYLAGIEIELVEHFVVADGTFFGIMNHCNNR